MPANYSDQTLAPIAASPDEAEPTTTGGLVYQGATVLAILLFLISFWSC
jgi:hypothetical protein